MSGLSLDLPALDRALAVSARLTKKFDPDQPRAENGQWGSGGGGSGGSGDGSGGGGTDADDDDDHEDGPGTGYEPEDQERHDRASGELLGHVARLQSSLDRASTVFHDARATADQIAEAAEAIGRHFDAADAALTQVNDVRDLYGDEHEEVSVLDASSDLREAVDGFRETLGALRAETRDRASLNAQIQAQSADPATQALRDLEAALRGL